MDSLKEFHEKKEELNWIYNGLKDIYERLRTELNVEIFEDSTFKKIKEQINNDKFTIAVVGVIKRGKSTLLNAILKAEEEILPTDVTPETARLMYLLYDEKKHAKVFFNDGSGEEVSMEDLPKYTSAADGLFKRGKKELSAKTVYAEVYHPNELLKNDTIIVDTPGMDDPDQQRSEVTEKFISLADAAIFLIDATQGGLKEFELKFMRSRLLNSSDKKGIIVVVNKIGALRKRQLPELEKLVTDTRNFLENEFRIQMPVYEIDAKDAWDGFKKQDDELIKKSKFLHFVNSLEKMLIDKKGRILLNKRSTDIKYDIIKPLQECLQFELNMTSNDLMSLKQELDLLEKSMSEKECQYQTIRKDYERKLLRLKNDIQMQIKEKVDKIKPDPSNPLSKLILDEFRGFAESVENKIKQELEEYFRQLGSVNIEIPNLKYSIDYPAVNISDYSSTKKVRKFGNVNSKALVTGYVAGNAIPVIGGFIGAAIAGAISVIAGITTVEETVIDPVRLTNAILKTKQSLINAYSDKIDSNKDVYEEKISEWFDMEKKVLLNKKQTLNNKKITAEAELELRKRSIKGFLYEISQYENKLGLL